MPLIFSNLPSDRKIALLLPCIRRTETFQGLHLGCLRGKRELVRQVPCRLRSLPVGRLVFPLCFSVCYFTRMESVQVEDGIMQQRHLKKQRNGNSKGATWMFCIVKRAAQGPKLSTLHSSQDDNKVVSFPSHDSLMKI